MNAPSGATTAADPGAFRLDRYLTEKRTRVDESLCNYLQQQENKVPDRLLQAMSYSLMAGGKRLRPILCLAACEAVRGDDAPAMATGCALEMIHTYSLIHDDLPAMDNDALRRGKPTCHVRYDEATAILAGDALLTLAFEVLAADMQTGNRPPCPAGGSIIHLVARAAGPGGMIGGQVLDILSEGDPMSTDALENLHRLKTGEMIVAAVKTGAMIGAASDEQLGDMEQYARKIGLAFQVMDDILNVEGDPSLMGKSTGTDVALGKNTYPALMGLEASRDFARELVTRACGRLRPLGAAAAPLQALATYIVNRNR
jgi:geranylgeranyl diphosphate synthase type II